MNLIALELQNVPPAAGRGEVTQPSQPPPGQPVPSGAPGGMGSMGLMLVMFLPMVLLIWFMNRSQTKKQKELENKLKRGDQVLVVGGVVGKIAELGNRYAKIEIAPGVKIQILKSAIQGLDSGEEPALAAKDAAKGKSDAPDKSVASEKK